jgi:hypothetical protein
MLHPEMASEPPTRNVSKIRGSRTSIMMDCKRFELPVLLKIRLNIASGVAVCEGPIKSEASMIGKGSM